MLNNKTFTVMDVEQFPVITMKIFPETLEDANNWTAEMDIVLNEKRKFVLVYPSINKKDKEHKKEDMEGIKAVRRWLKAGKALLSEYCAGMIMTTDPQKNDKEQLLQLSSVISAVYGVPVFVAETLGESYIQANELVK
ncbi:MULTISPECIES: hypothetical protein [Proteus]|uniref:hypothetical protein n=1 Tax=Proteus TaxID=583 RepID=UPI000BFBC298|nr:MULTISPECIES: hypothetical protein [Proteus]ATN00379.1 hypothetical protein CRN77_11850 [Proteus vulgaris]MBJ2107809.1 hypothetical protein [Proteus terrae]MBJ2131681.1 hypothetical protein [Proteus terrae]MCO7051178.1 hypothetical protein [Proteus terrae]MCS6715315.1 hypothetical protein [Proteus terrae]